MIFNTPDDSAFPTRAHRSCLSVPASSERKLEKARESTADELVLDLEDAVVPEAKPDSRAALIESIPTGSWHPAVSVRINGPGTPWCDDDVSELGALGRPLVSLVVPKVEGIEDLEYVARLLDAAEAASPVDRPPVRLQAIIESARGLARLTEITMAPRLDGLILGYADLAASLGHRSGADEILWDPARHEVLVAARSAGVEAIDGPWLGVADDEPFRAAAGRARNFGYDGKWAIHPAQIAALNEIFTPDAAELEHAQRVVDALDRAAREATGAVSLDGQMIDRALELAARRTLSRARG